MKVVVGVSNRHVHLTKEDYEILFGNTNIEVRKQLVQPGQFASNSLVTIKTEKSTIENVRVLGPFRNYTQAEISKTDAFKLGINPPIRDSGDVEGSALVTIIGPNGSIEKNCCIIATRHIHMSLKEQEELGFKDISSVSVSFNTQKSVVFHDVKIKASENGAYEMHIDTDDANGSFIKDKDEGMIII